MRKCILGHSQNSGHIFFEERCFCHLGYKMQKDRPLYCMPSFFPCGIWTILSIGTEGISFSFAKYSIFRNIGENALTIPFLYKQIMQFNLPERYAACESKIGRYSIKFKFRYLHKAHKAHNPLNCFIVNRFQSNLYLLVFYVKYRQFNGYKKTCILVRKNFRRKGL